MSDVPITFGIGQASVATERIGARDFQVIKIVGGETGSTSVMGVNPDRSINVSVLGVVTVTGSILTVGNASVSGTVGVSVIGWVPIQPANTSIITRWADSSLIGVVTGSVIAIPTGNQSVSGAVNVSGSVLLGNSNASVITISQNSSIIAIVTGSVIALGNQSVSGAVNVSGSVLLGSSNASIIALLQSSSIIAINAGSVIAVPSGSVITILQSPSIVGTYAEDAASASGDKGFLVMGARNDTLASVTSNDGDYSSHIVGPAGELIAANAPFTKWVQGTQSFLGGTPLNGGSVAVVVAQGASIFTYITSGQIMNPSANNVFIRVFGATDSIIGFTVAPANGGSNLVIPNAWKSNANGAVSASVSGSASVYIALQGFISKT